MSAKVKTYPKIGEIYYMKFEGRGNEQSGWRPGLVFQNNLGNKFSPNIIALPLTSKIKKTSQPTHTLLTASESGLPRDSMVLCENPKRMSKEFIGGYITTISAEQMGEVATSYLLATAAISFINIEALPKIWEQSYTLNSVTV